MFTGIVEDIASVAAIEPRDKEVVFTFEVSKADMSDTALGDSIAVNGACLTVTSFEGRKFTVEASHETLARTNLGKLAVGDSVNIERALRVGGKLGGHIVNGHVDGLGRVVKKLKQGDSVEFTFSVPGELARYIVEKGSVAVDGVSLTVNLVAGNLFTVNIIPHTLKETLFGSLDEGALVNIECDIIGKYVEKLMPGGGDG